MSNIYAVKEKGYYNSETDEHEPVYFLIEYTNNSTVWVAQVYPFRNMGEGDWLYRDSDGTFYSCCYKEVDSLCDDIEIIPSDEVPEKYKAILDQLSYAKYKEIKVEYFKIGFYSR